MQILKIIYNVLDQGFLSFHFRIFRFRMLILAGSKRRKYGLITLISGLIPYFAFPAAYVYTKNPQLFSGGNRSSYFWRNPYTQIGWYNISYLLFFVYATLLRFLSFDISWKRAIFVGVSAYTAQNLLYNTETRFNCTAFKNRMETWPQHLFSSLYHIVLYVLFYLICGRSYRKERIIDFNTLWLLSFLVISIVIINVFSQWLFIQNYEGDLGYVNLGIATYSAFCALLLLGVQFGFFQQSKDKIDKEVREKVIEKADNQRHLSKDNVDFINRKVHDLKHQVRVLKGRAGEDERKKALDEIDYSLNIYDSDIKTGNKVLDVVIREKGLQCKANHIDFSVRAEGEELKKRSKSDIFILFGNRFDNAIEASKKEEEANRIIVLGVRKCKGFLQIKRENYSSKSPEFKNGLPLSTKSNDGNHGFGTRSRRLIAEKYSGERKVSWKNRTYTVDVIIPL